MRLARWVLVFSIVFSSLAVKAEPTREFIMSATYGVLAGTLVGAATLAFTDNPGDNLKNIARGASFGLYAGILLGLYVVYGVPGEGDEDAPPPPSDEGMPPTMDDPNYDDQSFLKRMPSRRTAKRVLLPSFYPVITEKGVEGAGLGLQYTF